MQSCFSLQSALRLLVIAASLTLARLADAQVEYNVQLDTASLMGNANGPFSLDFQFNDGAGWGDGNNSAVISGFDFGGGSPTGSATTFGNATGDLWSSVTLQDWQPFNELFQGFTPGSWLSFTVSLSTWPDAGGTPDAFTFAILDSNLMNLATNALNNDAFVEIDIDSSSPTPMSFGSADGAISAPVITAVPEASTYGVLGVALLGLIALKRRKTK